MLGVTRKQLRAAIRIAREYAKKRIKRYILKEYPNFNSEVVILMKFHPDVIWEALLELVEEGQVLP